MTKIYAELDDIRFHYDSKDDIASIATYRAGEGYDVTELSIEDLRALNRYIQQVLDLKEQCRWEAEQKNRNIGVVRNDY